MDAHGRHNQKLSSNTTRKEHGEYASPQDVHEQKVETKNAFSGQHNRYDEHNMFTGERAQKADFTFKRKQKNGGEYAKSESKHEQQVAAKLKVKPKRDNEYVVPEVDHKPNDESKFTFKAKHDKDDAHAVFAGIGEHKVESVLKAKNGLAEEYVNPRRVWTSSISKLNKG